MRYRHRPTKCIRPGEGRKVIIPGKHKYLWPLDAEIRKRIALLAKPYPKRPASFDSEAATDQVTEGGERPTAGLQVLDTGSR